MAGLVFAGALGGCAHLDTFAGPRPAFSVDSDIAQLSAQFGSATSITEYYKQPETLDRRNAFIAGRLTLYNLEYIKYIHNFTLDKAAVDSAFDITNLGIELSTTLVGRPYTKTVMGAASALLTGSRLSLTKNFLDDKTTAALVSQMNASRKVAVIPILAGMQQQPANYPLGAAIVDLQNYFEAGTPEGALQSVQTNAAQQAATADRAIAQYRTVSFTLDDGSTAIRKWLYPTATTKSPSGQMLGGDGKPAAADTTRVTQLRQWMIANGWSGLPIQQLLDGPDFAQERQAAMSALTIPAN
jgi:hypothetical protein